MPAAEIITIGTEILLGEIIDTNARYIARNLRDIGVDLYRKTTVGDNVQRIAQALREGLSRADILITTGGLGPTVDDPTREAAALAVGVDTEYRPELWEQIQTRFKNYGRQPTENNRRQAYIPKGALAVENPVGTAPSFIIEKEGRCIISLPGVPIEMEYLMQNAVIPYLRQKYQLHSIIKAHVIHTVGIGESVIDELVGDLETYANPTVGLAAHSGQVDVRITVKADSEEEADARIALLEQTIQERLGKWIYGVNDETLEDSILKNLNTCGLTLATVEAGLHGELVARCSRLGKVFVGGEVLNGQPSGQELLNLVQATQINREADIVLGVSLIPGAERQVVYLALATAKEQQVMERSYGGAPQSAPRWAMNHALDLLRNYHPEAKQEIDREER